MERKTPDEVEEMSVTRRSDANLATLHKLRACGTFADGYMRSRGLQVLMLASRSAGRWHSQMRVPDACPVGVEGLERLQRVMGVHADLAVCAARHDQLLAGQEARREDRMPCTQPRTDLPK